MYPFFSFPLFLWHLAVLLWLTSWRVCVHTHLWCVEIRETDFRGLICASVMWHVCAQGILGTVDCPTDSSHCLYWMEAIQGWVGRCKVGQRLMREDMGRWFSEALRWERIQVLQPMAALTAYPSFCFMTYPKSGCSLHFQSILPTPLCLRQNHINIVSYNVFLTLVCKMLLILKKVAWLQIWMKTVNVKWKWWNHGLL